MKRMACEGEKRFLDTDFDPCRLNYNFLKLTKSYYICLRLETFSGLALFEGKTVQKQ